MKETLLHKIASKNLTVGVIGLGYVGLPLSLRFVEAGFRVLGFDIDHSKVTMLNEGTSYIKHIGSEGLKVAVAGGHFEATVDFSRAHEADALIICVPTPLNKHRDPDLSFIFTTMDALRPGLRRGQIVSLESTTYPGTTEEELKPRIEVQGLEIGRDVFLVFSPEREDPGNTRYAIGNVPKIVGGATPDCLEVGAALYSHVTEQVVPVSSTRTAEFTKLLENIYRAVNIGLVNELKTVADPMGVDIWEVIDAASTKPFGFTPFYPGPGLGGHCIPIDPFYLVWKAREYGLGARFIELAGEVNTAMPHWVIGKITDALNEQGKAVKGAKVLVLGIAYKKNIDDMRESPAVELMAMLRDKGAEVCYADPYVPVFPRMRKYSFALASVELGPEVLSEADCVIVATDHDVFDYEMIREHSKVVVDTRGRYRQPLPNVVKA